VHVKEEYYGGDEARMRVEDVFREREFPTGLFGWEKLPVKEFGERGLPWDEAAEAWG